MERKIPVFVSLPQDLVAVLRFTAMNQGRSLSNLILEMIQRAYTAAHPSTYTPPAQPNSLEATAFRLREIVLASPGISTRAARDRLGVSPHTFKRALRRCRDHGWLAPMPSDWRKGQRRAECASLWAWVPTGASPTPSTHPQPSPP